MRYSISIGSPTPPEKFSLCCSLCLCGYSVLTNDTVPNETVEKYTKPRSGKRCIAWGVSPRYEAYPKQ